MRKIIASIAIGVAALIMLAASVTASRQEIPVGLKDIYGDTSGIHSLAIEGIVLSWNGRYAYTFGIGPGAAYTSMRTFTNNRGFASFYWSQTSRRSQFDSPWHTSMFHLGYAPIAPYEIISVESQRMFYHGPGGLVPGTEYRIYGNVFEVKPLARSFPLYVPNYTPGERRLFIKYEEENYIFSHHPEAGPAEFTPSIVAQRPMGLWLPEQLSIGDTHLFVPVGAGMFGDTAVYAVHISQGIVPMVYDYALALNMVQAEVLFPISLAQGKDAIPGLMRLENNDVLLVVKRTLGTSGLELTRICVHTGDNYTVFIEIQAVFHEHYLQCDSLIFFGTMADGTNIVAAVDLSNEGLAVAGVFPVALGGVAGDALQDTPIVINHDMLLSHDVVYIAYSVINGDFPVIGESIFISAHDFTGRLIGRSQVLNGIEDDKFWTWDFNNWGITGRSPIHQRRVQALSIAIAPLYGPSAENREYLNAFSATKEA